MSTKPNRRKPTLFRSVFVKSSAIVAAAVLTVATMLIASSDSLTRQAVDRTTSTIGGSLTRFAAESLGGALRFEKLADVEANLERLLTDTQGKVESVLVTRGGGEIFARAGGTDADTLRDLSRLAEAAMSSGQRAISNDGFLIAEPVLFGKDGEVVGVLAIAWSSDAVLADYRATQATELALAGAVALLFLAGAVWAFRRMLSSPLTGLSGAITEVSKGNYSIDVGHVDRVDEIGSIARSVTALQGQLDTAQKKNRDGLFKGAAFDSLPAALVAADVDMNIRQVNPAFLDYARAHLDEFRKLRADFQPDAVVGQHLGLVYNNLTQIRTIAENPGCLPHAEELWLGNRIVKILLNGICDEEGAISGYILHLADATDARRERSIVNAIGSSQIQIEFSNDWKLIQTNERFEIASSLSARRLAGKPADSLFAPEEGDWGQIRRQIGNGSWSGTLQMTCADDRMLEMEGSVFAVLDGAGKPFRFVFIGADVTAAREERRRVRKERDRMLAGQRQVVDELSVALSALSQGDLTARITSEFDGDYEKLRKDFNQATEQLEAALGKVVENVGAIHGETRQIATAADDLSRRTEQQAATLEETAAAVAELTASVQSSAEGARQAAQVVSEARDNAQDSGGVVREAVTAMSEIEASSNQISKIISLIDDIAFQTNLLALNAGVEAARAGDAGRGFAVVASEVRVLAQRSSDAAREINQLISTSGQHVKRGVKLVGDAGAALERIVDSVKSISEHVAGIAASASEQSTGLEEINTAMSQLDQVTQKNAAMFEETTAASHSLNREADTLAEVVRSFRISGKAAEPPRQVALQGFRSDRRAPGAPHGPAKIDAPARAVVQTRGSAALDFKEDNDVWEDF